MIKKVIILVLVLTTISSCFYNENKTDKNREFDRTNPIDKEEQNHLFLNLILERWENLSNVKLNWRDDNTIDIKEIVLIKYKLEFHTDTTNGFYFILLPHRINFDNSPNVEIIKDTILKQMETVSIKTWNPKFIHSTLKLDSCLTEENVSFVGELHNNNSFLVVSEPIEFLKDTFFVLTKLITDKYCIEAIYFIKKENHKWIIFDINAAVIRFSFEVKSSEKKWQYSIFDGYMN